MNGNNVIDLSRRYVRFYDKPVECTRCGELSRGRIYDSMQAVVCGYCGDLWWLWELDSEERWDG